MSAHPPAASPTCCSSAARAACTRSTSGAASSRSSLRHDARVTSRERTNARTLTAASLPAAVDLAVVDVSFISLARVLAPIGSTLAPGRTDRAPGQAPVRSRTRGRARRGRSRPGGPPARAGRDRRARPGHRAGRHGRRRLAVSSDPRAIASSCSICAADVATDPAAGSAARRAGGHRTMTIGRIGFAFNPTMPTRSSCVSGRPAGATSSGSSHGLRRRARPTPCCASCRAPTRSWSWAGTARSCGRRARWPTSTCRSWA